MNRGFVTIATGHERYYRMARTLLRSYRQTCPDPMPFAILCDRENEYTAEFDDVVILRKPTNSWMDKLCLLTDCPYDENIFIDADCIVYRDINFFWSLFEKGDDFSCFGCKLPLDANWGWFTAQAAEIYPIHFITHLHGICYFIRRGSTVDQLKPLCQDIIKNYHRVQFRQFSQVLADETIYALAMAVMDLAPVPSQKDYYCFAPCATKLRADYLSKTNAFCTPWDGDVTNGCIIHWSNPYTKRAAYCEELHKINYLHRRQNARSALHEWVFYRSGLLKLTYSVRDFVRHCWDFAAIKCNHLFHRN